MGIVQQFSPHDFMPPHKKGHRATFIKTHVHKVTRLGCKVDILICKKVWQVGDIMTREPLILDDKFIPYPIPIFGGTNTLIL